MNTYKTLINEQKHTTASQRAGPHKIEELNIEV